MNQEDDRECYERIEDGVLKSNHYWTDEDFDNVDTALCRKCGQSMKQWLENGLEAVRENLKGDILSPDG